MTIWLLPNILVENTFALLPSMMDKDFIASLDLFIAESERGGRAFLSHFKERKEIRTLSEHTTDQEIELWCQESIGRKVGVISDAGLPGIADPAWRLISAAKRKQIPIRALPGPCSITQIMLLSGFSGQRFAFHGYPPKEEKERLLWISDIERLSQKWNMPQIFIEAPYRNNAILENLIKILAPETLIGVGFDLCSELERVEIRKAIKWNGVSLNKQPATFLLKKD